MLLISCSSLLYYLAMIYGYLKMSNVSCHIVFDTSLFMCKIQRVLAISMPYLCIIAIWIKFNVYQFSLPTLLIGGWFNTIFGISKYSMF